MSDRQPNHDHVTEGAITRGAAPTGNRPAPARAPRTPSGVYVPPKPSNEQPRK